MRKAKIVAALAAFGAATAANAAPVVYNIIGSIDSLQDQLTTNSLTSNGPNYWNPTGTCPGGYTVGPAGPGNATCAGPVSGNQATITATAAPTFTGTITIDDVAKTVVMDITFDGTVIFRTPDILPPAPFNGAAVNQLDSWRQVVSWTTAGSGTINAASGSVVRGTSVSTGTQVCDWNNADSGSNAALCGSRQATASERAWGFRRTPGATPALDCTTATPNNGCTATVGVGDSTGDTNISYTVSGGSISGSGGYMERGWNSTLAAVNAFAYQTCTATQVASSLQGCGTRWVGALADASTGGGGNGSSYLGGALTFQSAPVIPVPAAVWLFGSALGLLGWARRRYQA